MTRDREGIVYFMILDDSLWVSSRWLDYVVQARKMAMKVVVAISKETGMVWEAQGSVGVYYYNSYIKQSKVSYRYIPNFP